MINNLLTLEHEYFSLDIFFLKNEDMGLVTGDI